MNKETIFTKKFYVWLFAMIAVISWAFAFPLIKIGFKEFAISSDDNWSKALFAGIRFFAAGALLILFAILKRYKTDIKNGSDIALLLVFGFVNTALHYFFFYLGLSYMDGSRSALYDSLSTFLLILFACIFFASDTMSWQKAIGCLIGFSGILVISINKSGFSLSFPGDMFMVLNSLCSAFGGILTRIVTKRMNPVYATGLSLSIGGFLLMVVGFFMGGRLHTITATGFIVLICLILISAVGFALYNTLIRYNPVGSVAIFNSFIPVLGALLSCIMLHEAFSYKYIIAAMLVTAGVLIVNKTKS